MATMQEALAALKSGNKELAQRLLNESIGVKSAPPKATGQDALAALKSGNKDLANQLLRESIGLPRVDPNAARTMAGPRPMPAVRAVEGPMPMAQTTNAPPPNFSTGRFGKLSVQAPNVAMQAAPIAAPPAAAPPIAASSFNSFARNKAQAAQQPMDTAMKKGGMPKKAAEKFAKGGFVKADGCAQRGKTRGRIV